MFSLRFNRYTLSFMDPDEELEYFKSISAERLLHFRVLSFTLIFLTILFTIFFILNNQIYPSISCGALGIMSLIVILISKQLENYLIYFYFFLYLFIIAISLIVTSFNAAIQPFVYGFTISQMTTSIAQYSHFKLRMFGYIIVPILQFIILQGYESNNFAYAILHFSSQLMILVYTHQSEYLQRLAFTLLTYNKKQKELLCEFVTQPLIAISLNQRTQQFMLELQNQKAKQYLGIEDDKSMINVLRHIQITQINQNPQEIQLIQSSGIQSINIQKNEQIVNQTFTLEEQAYKIIQDNVQLNNEIKYQGTLKMNFPQKQIMIGLKKIFYRKSTLFIFVLNDEESFSEHKKDQEILYQNRILKYVANELKNMFYNNVYNLLSKKNQKIKEQDFIYLLKSNCLLFMNTLQNFQAFIYSNYLSRESQNIETKPLIYNLDYLIKQVQMIALCNNNTFISKNYINENITMKTNIVFLNQIILNTFQIILSKVMKKTEIIFSITSSVINKKASKQSREVNLVKKFDDSDSEEELQLSVIKFQYEFYTDSPLEIISSQTLMLNPITLQDYQYNNRQDINIITPVTHLLLKYLGPEDKVYCYQIQNEQDSSYMASNLFKNILIFSVYNDITQLPSSYYRGIEKNPIN